MAKDLTKRLYVQNVEGWKKILSDGKFSSRKLSVKVVDNGIILPARKHEVKRSYTGGVCDKNFNFIAGYTRKANGKLNHSVQLDSAYEVDRKDIVQLDEDVIFGGVLNGHFGHFLTENCCRLWYVLQHPELKLKVLFIIAWYGYKSWFDDLFKLMGIDEERIIYVDKPTQCRSITVPDQSQYWDDFTREWLAPFQAIKDRVKPGKPKKLYLTRTKFESVSAHIYNEEYFEDFFSNRGFEVVSMEQLSLKEQIALIMGADEIASTIGTLTHWALFCKPSAKFIMFPRTKLDDGHFQRVINNAFPNYYIVEVSKNFMYEYHNVGENLIGSTKYWKEFVADYFGEDISEDDDNPYFAEALNKYITAWCQRYIGAKAENFDKVTSSFRDMCNRIITLERERIKCRPLLTYQTHVGRLGWSSWTFEDQVSNSIDKPFDLQAIKINFSQPFYGIFYSVYYDKFDGWSEEVAAPEVAGTTGQFKSITGIKIRLDASAKQFDILYRVHTFDGEWTSWAKNGEELTSQGVKLNAVQIKLVSK